MLAACAAVLVAGCAGSKGGAATPASKPPARLAKEPVIRPPAAPAPTKLVVRDLVRGSGDEAKPGDEVTVNYVGALYESGKVFDSSWERHTTFTTQLSNGSVISGWVKGILGERVGGRRELIIPPNLAYGSAGSPPKIPPNATLIFAVDLLSVSGPSGDD